MHRGRGVALGGFMGTGKSTIGALLAARLDLPLIDLDRVLEARFGPIPQQFRDEGEPAFRARERALVREVVAGPDAVIATGGGCWAHAPSRRALRRRFATVVLTAPLAELRRRIEAADGARGAAARPRWREGEVAALLAERRAAYADADLRLDTAGRSPAAVADAIVAWLDGSERET